MRAGRRITMAVLTRPGADTALWVVGLLAVGGAGTLALRGAWPGAVACAAVAVAVLWLAGLWVWPRGADAYLRRVSRAIAEWRVATERPGGYVGSTTRAVERLEAARPPQRAAAAHAELVAAFVANEAAERAVVAAEVRGDQDAIGPAHARADAAYADLRTAYNAVVADLGEDLRLPPRE